MGFPVVDRVYPSDEESWWEDGAGVLESGEGIPSFKEPGDLAQPIGSWGLPGGVSSRGVGKVKGTPVVTRVRWRTLCACLCWILGTTLGLFGLPLIIEAICHLSAFGTLLSGLMIARASSKDPIVHVVLLDGTNPEDGR